MIAGTKTPYSTRPRRRKRIFPRPAICPDCGSEFEQRSPKHKRCSTCQVERRRSYKTLQNAGAKGQEFIDGASPCTNCFFLDRCRVDVLAMTDEPYCMPASKKNRYFLKHYKGSMPGAVKWDVKFWLYRNGVFAKPIKDHRPSEIITEVDVAFP